MCIGRRWACSDVRREAVDTARPEGTPIPIGTSIGNANDLPGAEQLVRRITSGAKQRQLTVVVIGLEATGMLGWHLRTYLSQVPELQPLKPIPLTHG